ncbi:neutral zinc metallopeptidase [Paramuribaculum intestinale]|uniref:Neutral zinc metallopeptidase n=2 Tax=Paramuribaculum intestinale TaxID=2094151 RepID=A0A2V1IXZ9_9BACT|nr:neutral zinc metallopeptidase [Paramuribaculum intestinale]MBJ2185275.1 neutral zinc metallopeptidase [Muribaculaceae bacterium]ROS92838.1 neutral zinc metallopeptidase [Muribaculaceae bacterium Isolate-043 (Harlan)]MCX4329745.1 zinc metallopeptidase [Paramuribaculum intestinale]PWB08902.1 neutral zinc metallopeptidase [Paramuribaculum intestinale]PWB11442.1 neutral zinc metallopeptidase [Paramuribaculum intestinale]
MKLSGRRQSSNIEDRRRSGGKVAAGGIGAVIVAALIAWISGGNPLEVVMGNAGQLLGGGTSQQQAYVPDSQDEELEQFVSTILAGTEDVWTEEFQRRGLTYEPPKLVLFNGSVQSGCGGATAQTGPFYCSADESVYIDLSFLKEMRQTIGAGGDFAFAYVIAHEVGHHVQNQLGILGKAHEQMSRLSKSEANKISVRLELQADYLAGVWAHNDNKRFNSLEEGDLEEALDAAMKIGDDYLQKRAHGYAVPESFNHGTSDQRSRWLRKGVTDGTIEGGDTFTPAYSSL